MISIYKCRNVCEVAYFQVVPRADVELAIYIHNKTDGMQHQNKRRKETQRLVNKEVK